MGDASQLAVLNDSHFNKSVTTEFSVPITAGTVVTPTSGKALQIKGVLLTTQATAGRIRLYFTDDENDAINTVAVIYAENQPGYIPVILKGDTDAVLKIDSNITDEFFVLVNYKER